MPARRGHNSIKILPVFTIFALRFFALLSFLFALFLVCFVKGFAIQLLFNEFKVNFYFMRCYFASQVLFRKLSQIFNILIVQKFQVRNIINALNWRRCAVVFSDIVSRPAFPALNCSHRFFPFPSCFSYYIITNAVLQEQENGIL